jgi:hypothetical protein
LEDPRLSDLKSLGRVLEDEYAVLRDKYGMTLVSYSKILHAKIRLETPVRP